jgi:hypothetical protein
VRWRARAEGRQHERVELVAPLLIITHGASGEQYDEGVSINVSESGVAFETEADLNLGNLADLIFEAEGEPPVSPVFPSALPIRATVRAYFIKLD